MEEKNQSALDLVEGMRDMPSLPQLFYQIKKEVSDPYSTIARIAEVISLDQSLTARMLRLANSAFFGFPRRIETITDAVSLIGLQQVRDLALCTMVIEIFDKIDTDLVDMNSFWRHSLGCGICARVLAAHHREPNIERFFVAGLIHDLGRLIMLMQLPDRTRKIFALAQEHNQLLYKVEREVLNYDHGDIGAALLQAWQLPDPMIEAAGLHHRPVLSVGFPMETAIVHFSDLLTHALELGSSGERYIPTLSEDAWKRLNFKPTVLANVLREVDRQFAEVVNIMLAPSKR
jgi:HD-like signal output (HDOD) protein